VRIRKRRGLLSFLAVLTKFRREEMEAKQKKREKKLAGGRSSFF